jgi:hypothetical protein
MTGSKGVGELCDEETIDAPLLPCHLNITSNNCVVHFTSLYHHKDNSNKIKFISPSTNKMQHLVHYAKQRII